MSTDKSSHPDSHRSIIKSTGILALGTLTSRILGFFRDILLAKILGTGFQADALFVAFRIPNMFRDLVGEGACNSAVVPVISEYQVTRTKQEFSEFISAVSLIAMMLLSLITLLGVMFTPVIVRVLAPGFAADTQKILLTIKLTRILFPYLILVGLTAYTMAVLNTYRLFFTPAFSPCVLNIAVILGTLLSARYLADPVYGLAWSIIIGGILQLAFQIPSLMRLGISWQKPRQLNHPGVVKVGRLLLPRLLGSGVYQLNIFVDTFCASLSSIVGTGGIAAIYYANRLIQFPIGVFGFAMAAAVLPTLSSLAASRNLDRLRTTLAFALENILFIMFPFSVLMIFLAHPIVRVLFERGEFDQYSTMITSSALTFFALGLYSYGGVKILVTTFHSLQDTRTPVKVATVCLLINILLNIILMKPLKIGGIALASTISSSVNFFWLLAMVKRKLGALDPGLKTFVIKALSATLIMALIVLWARGCLFVINEMVTLGVIMALGLLVYVGAAYILNIRQARKTFEWLLLMGKHS